MGRAFFRKPDNTRPFRGGRPSGQNFQGGRGGGRQGGGRVMTTFNPSMLVREVKEFAPSVEFVPSHTFEDFDLHPQLLSNIKQKNYTVVTPIQDQAIPAMLEGRDVIGIANTGTGKTAAFLIPLINKVLSDRNKRVIILAPTRELAVQIRDELDQFTRGMNIYSVVLIGGVKSFRQKNGSKA